MLGFDNKMRNYIRIFAHPNENHENEAPCFCHKDDYFKVSQVKLVDGSKWFLKDVYISYLDTYVPPTMLKIIDDHCPHKVYAS